MAFKIEAIRLTKDPYSTKVAYEKDGVTYVRTGKDGFKTGIPSPSIDSLTATWGFRQLVNPVSMDKGEGVLEALSLGYFSINRQGYVEYR